MAWAIPTTALVGNTIDAPYWNTNGRDNLLYLHDNSWFRDQETILSGTATSITFSSLNTTFSGIIIVGCLRADDAGVGISQVNLQFNADTGSNYSYNLNKFAGNGTQTAQSALNAAYIRLGDCPAATAPSNTFGAVKIVISNFQNTFSHKITLSTLSCKQAASATTDLFNFFGAGYWQSTSAITSIKIYLNSGTNLISGSYLDWYGIA